MPRYASFYQPPEPEASASLGQLASQGPRRDLVSRFERNPDPAGTFDAAVRQFSSRRTEILIRVS